jgi:hypothetical protein
MDPLNTTKEHSPVTYLVAGVALFLAGAVVWVFVDPYLPASLSNSQKGYQTGFTAARTLVEKSDLGTLFRTQINRSTITGTISGTVTAIQGNRINIHDSSLQNDSLNTLFNVPFITDRTVIVDTNTKVVRLAESTSTTPQTGINSHQVAGLIKPDGSISLASSTNTYLETPASVSDINIGDVLIVIAQEGAKTETELSAQEILIAPPVK